MFYYLARLVVIAALSYAAACVGLVFLQRHVIYIPAEGADKPEAFGLVGVDVVTLDTPDGEKLETWTWEGLKEKPVIVFFHGNAGNLEDRFGMFQMFKNLGFGFIAVDYRGYGNSTGSPTYKSLITDALLVLDHTSSASHFAGRKVVLYGESLGTGVATEAATKRTVDGVVLQSPYTSIADAAKDRFPWLPVDLLLTERFTNVPQIAHINAPLLVLHGEEDELFPVSMAQNIFDMASGEKRIEVLAGVGHNDIYPEGIRDILVTFVESIIGHTDADG